MRLKLMTAGLLGAVTSVQPALGQAVQQVPHGGTAPKPVPMQPPADASDTPEEIAKDAARDLKDTRFYNKPGATRAQYNADWQECRLIARGSRTPSGSVPYYYNPAVISPVAAGIGGGIGGLIAGKIAEGQQRRANRRSCLMIRGWRLVELPSAEAARVTAMTDDQRGAYFDTIVGAPQVNGAVTERTSFSLEPDPALHLDAPVIGPGSVFVGKKLDPRAPIALERGEAAVVVAYRRPDSGSAGRTGTLQMLRYDANARDLIYQPKDWKKKGDKTTYAVIAKSADKKAAHEVQVVRVTPGDYVLSSTAVGALQLVGSNCFGAPTFHVGEGEVAYLGDFIPYLNVKRANGEHVSTLAYTAHVDDARRTLATAQPTLAAALKPAAFLNGATYACSAIVMDRWDLPGYASLPPAAPPVQAADPGTVTASN